MVQVKLVGYKTIIKTIDLAETSVMIFELEESAVEATEVVVTGLSKATEIKTESVADGIYRFKIS